MKRFDALLSILPTGCIFDGELVVLDREGHPAIQRAPDPPMGASLRRL
jgi:hypothetical protein